MGKPEVFEIPDNANISVSPVMEPSLSNDKSDPFNKHKTEPNKFHYRALNKKPQNISVKEAMGYQTIGGSEFGDLVLAKLPRERFEARRAYALDKARKAVSAAREGFNEEARRSGVKTFEER